MIYFISSIVLNFGYEFGCECFFLIFQNEEEPDEWSAVL